MSPAATTSSSLKLSLDFSQVKDGAVSAHVPEGDYLLRITGIKKKKTTDESKGIKDFLEFACTIVKGRGKGVIYTRCFLTEASLWNLRNLMVACLGADRIPKTPFAYDFAKMIGKEFTGTVADGDPYGAKQIIKSEIVNYAPASDYNEDAVASTEDEASDLDTDSDEEETLDEIDTDDL